MVILYWVPSYFKRCIIGLRSRYAIQKNTARVSIRNGFEPPCSDALLGDQPSRVENKNKTPPEKKRYGERTRTVFVFVDDAIKHLCKPALRKVVRVAPQRQLYASLASCCKRRRSYVANHVLGVCVCNRCRDCVPRVLQRRSNCRAPLSGRYLRTPKH